MNSLEDKQNYVYKILLTPIYCNKEYSNIEYKEDKILTGQKYIRSADEDMSNFTIGFYKILYKDILQQNPILKENGNLFNNEFAGDTINSFARIANRTPGAGKSNKERTLERYWPDYLVLFNKQYHCLANFWMIPMGIGRTLHKWSKAKKSWDYMDRFLKTYIENKEIYIKMYPTYFSAFDGIKDFAQRHFLLGSYINANMEIDIYSDTKKYDSHAVIKRMQEKVELRARCISESKYTTELWEYFNNPDYAQLIDMLSRIEKF